ncbi:zinc ABC transporter substrate-binding protein [Fundidesulfovibrio butyratiphilus]
MKLYQPLLLLLALTLVPPVGVARAGSAQEKPLIAVASIAPLGRIAAVVAGHRAEVVVLVPAGADPHTFEPKPSQMALIAKAKLFFSQGVEYEHAWLPKFRKINPNMTVVNTTAGIDLLPLEAHDHHKVEPDHDKADHDHGADGGQAAAKHDHDADEHHHEAMATDPHTWTSPTLAAKQAATIAQALTKADPEGAKDYQAGLAAFQAEAKELDAAIRQRLSGVKPGAKFVTFHPAWAYFAKAYGLEEVPIQAGGREPGPKTLQRIIEQAKGLGVKVVLVQPQFSRVSAQAVAEAIGAKVVVADPLAGDWADNLLSVADAIARAAR